MSGAAVGVSTASRFVYRVARPITSRDHPEYWSTRARVARQLFPSDILVLARDGNDVATSGKLTLRTPPHLGKRDIIEYLRKVYGLRARKVNSMNYPGKLKRGVLPRAHGQKTYRTKAFKKFIVTLDPDLAALPEARLDKAAIEAEVVRPQRKD